MTQEVPPIASRVPVDPGLTAPRPRSRLRRGCFRAAAVGLVLAALAIAWLWLWPPPSRIEKRWLDQAGFDPRVDYPAREANETALRVEELAARLGIEIAPPDAPGRSRPSDDAAEELGSLRSALADFVNGRRQVEPPLDPPPPELLALLAGAEPVLDEIVVLLESSDPPLWEVDLGAGLRTELPSMLGHLALHRLLVIRAGEAARQRDPVRAMRSLEAAWRLRTGTARDPRLISQLVSLVEIEDELALLRALPFPVSGWPERLAAMRLREGMEVALRLESWLMVQALTSGQLQEELDDSGIVYVLGTPFVKRGVAGYVEFMEHGLDGLRTADLRTFDNQTFFEREYSRIPRWNVAARLLAPNFLGAWVKAAHAELGVDLTCRAIEARELLRRGDLAGLEALAAAQPATAIEDVRWIYRVEPESVVIEASDGIPRETPHPLPLKVRIDRHRARP